MDRRIAGDGSSPSRPTTLPAWKKKKLWHQLRKLDRQISKLSGAWSMSFARQFINKIIKLDEKRKKIRNQLKGYKNES